MKDFTLRKYRELLKSALESGYVVIPFRAYLSAQRLPERFIILRHDVDQHPKRAVLMGLVEKRLGVSASYYFRNTPLVFHPEYIRKLSDLGHEIGYHYENLSRCRGNHQKAIQEFREWLEAFRMIVPVETICPHGSPLSRFNNSRLWQEREYEAWNISGDISRDTDFSTIIYLTDTGRSWNSRSNRRDRVKQNSDFQIESTSDFIQAFQSGHCPPFMMINIHPQRWTNNPVIWVWEKWSQVFKNILKYTLFSRRYVNR